MQWVDNFFTQEAKNIIIIIFDMMKEKNVNPLHCVNIAKYVSTFNIQKKMRKTDT